MYPVNNDFCSKEFLDCWKAVGMHIQAWGGREVRWIKADPYPPYLEHFSFFYGNQVYFIRIEDENHILDIPGTQEGFLSIASGWKGHACRIVMRKRLFKGWNPKYRGWGLQEYRTNEFINPAALATDEKIEIGDWELFDFACQIVREDLQKKGFHVLSSCRNPSVYPSIWFEGPNGREWILVVPSRAPAMVGDLPEGFGALKTELTRRGFCGHLAQVSFASLNPNDSRLIRGEGADIHYKGLSAID